MILFIASDPGGINALLPIHDKLTKHFVCEFWISSKSQPAVVIPYFRRLSFLEEGNEDKLDSWIKSKLPQLILTATSGLNSLERDVWRSAKGLSVKTYAVLDYWGNYGSRFSKILQDDYSLKSKEYIFPDQLFVMDEISKNEVLGLGINKEKVVVTGNPHFQKLYTTRNELKNGLNRVVIFSEPINELYDTRKEYGFDEYSIIDMIYEAVKCYNKHLRVSVKFHPKQSVESNKIKHINDIEISTCDTLTLIKDSDIVFGTLTTALIESAICNRNTICVIPDEAFDERSAYIVKGLGVPQRSNEDIMLSLKNKRVINTNLNELNVHLDSVALILNELGVDYE